MTLRRANEVINIAAHSTAGLSMDEIITAAMRLQLQVVSQSEQIEAMGREIVQLLEEKRARGI